MILFNIEQISRILRAQIFLAGNFCQKYHKSLRTNSTIHYISDMMIIRVSVFCKRNNHWSSVIKTSPQYFFRNISYKCIVYWLEGGRESVFGEHTDKVEGEGSTNHNFNFYYDEKQMGLAGTCYTIHILHLPNTIRQNTVAHIYICYLYLNIQGELSINAE